MRLKTKGMIAWAILVAALIVGASSKTYLIREHSGGTILWNASEAYLFVGISRQGLHVSRLRYPWVLTEEYLGGVESPDDDRESLLVIRVTPSGVDRHVLGLEERGPGGGPTMATPMDGRIYVNFPELGGLCWWATDHFEAATEDERRRLDGINRLKEGDFDNGVNGWSKRRFGPATRDNGFTLHVGDKFGLSIDGLAAKENTNGTVSIDLLRPAKTPERIWDFYARRGRISKAEYQHLFQDRE